MVGIGGLVARMLVHLVTLPTEWDASFGKALPVLAEGNYVAPAEIGAVRKILRAAADVRCRRACRRFESRALDRSVVAALIKSVARPIKGVFFANCELECQRS